MMGRGGGDDAYPCSSSSSIDSNTNDSAFHYQGDSRSESGSCCSSSRSSNNNNRSNGCHYSSKDLSTDLRLGLSISSLSHPLDLASSPRGQYSDWPPIKAQLRNTIAGKRNSRLLQQQDSLFVKVYMEGLLIGRKLDLLDHLGYHSLISTLSLMFTTTILFPDVVGHTHTSSDRCHILTYEDKEGDWMMVGDVPWELFLTTVKRLKIATFHKCT